LSNSYDISVARCNIKNRELFIFLEKYDDNIVLLKRDGGVYFNKNVPDKLEKKIKNFIRRENIKNQENLVFYNSKKTKINVYEDKFYIDSCEYKMSGELCDQSLPRLLYILFANSSNDMCFFNDNFILYAKNSALKFVDELGKFLDANGAEKTQLTMSKNPEISQLVFSILKENFHFVVVFFLVVLVLILNTLNAVKYWLTKQKISLGIKRLSGASAFNIFIEVFINYFIILTLSFLLGSSFLFFVQNLDFFKSKNISLFTTAFFGSFLVVFFLGCLTSFFMLFNYCKNSIVNMLK
jgi:hypothetical protein